MKFFIDTAKVEDIKAANDMGVICGVTTNPSLIAKEGRDFKEVILFLSGINYRFKKIFPAMSFPKTMYCFYFIPALQPF